MSLRWVSERHDGPAALLELQRPDQLNALSLEVIDDVVSALDTVDADPAVRGVVISGAGRAFSSGADLVEALEATDAASALRYVTRLRRLTTAIEACSKPVVAAIHGACYTGGVELALACDRRVASMDASFSVSSARIGSVAGLGGTQRLPRLVGASVAKDILMTGRVLAAAEAKELGLVDELVPEGASVKSAVTWVEAVAESAPMAVWLAKIAVNTGTDLDLPAALQMEGLMTSLAFTTEDRREGMSSILEKRKPTFGGR
jgi:enoyl-CoA hydratase/carnithine racemase